MLTRIPLLPFDKFPNYRYIRHVHCPVLVMHSHADSVIGFWHGQKMYELANQPKRLFWVTNADHNEMDLAKGYDEAIQSFAATLEKAHPTSAAAFTHRTLIGALGAGRAGQAVPGTDENVRTTSWLPGDRLIQRLEAQECRSAAWPRAYR